MKDLVQVEPGLVEQVDCLLCAGNFERYLGNFEFALGNYTQVCK